MSFPAKAIANEFLRIADENSEPLSAMKLQKLVFFAHGWTLAFTGKPLISEDVEAWDWGPVIPSLYHEFKKFGSGPITGFAHEGTFKNLKFVQFAPSIDAYSGEAERSTAKEIVERIWDEYSSFSAARLSNATHQLGTPWQKVYQPGKKHVKIPNETIKTYFEGLAHAQ